MQPQLEHNGGDYRVVFNPEAKRVLTVNLLHTFPHTSVVTCVRISRDGKYLATGCNRTTQIYDLATGHKICTLEDESVRRTGDLYIRCVCFSPDGKYLATGAEDGLIRIWDISRRRIWRTLHSQQNAVYSVVFSHDGKVVVAGSERTMRSWDLIEPSNNKVFAIDEYGKTTTDPDNGITSIDISPNGHLVAAGSLDASVRIWDLATGQLLGRLCGHKDSVYSVRLTPDGRGLISGSFDTTMKHWNIPTATSAGEHRGIDRCTMSFEGHTKFVLTVAVSPDGQWVASGSKDCSVMLWDAQTATRQCTLISGHNSVISVDFSPTAPMLATGSGDKQARVWSYSPYNGP
ncbi:WD40-repeat-containing domain protein [Schizophyllum fasciatum]